MGAQFTVKLVRQQETDSNIAFIGLPITTDPRIVKQPADKVLKPLVKLTKEDPTNFPTFRHPRSDWIEYKITKSLPLGMPFEKYNGTKIKNP